jgi:hypothetical protein
MASTAVDTAPPARAEIQHEGFSVSSNTGTADDLRRDLGVEPSESDSPHATADTDADPEAPPEKLKADEQYKRIATKTYEAEEAKRVAEAARKEADDLKAENARLKAERERPVERDEPRRTEDEQQRYEQWKAGHDDRDPKPKVSDFDDHDQYLDARDQWNERRFERRADRANQERAHHERQAAVRHAATTFQGRMDAEVAKDPSFKDIIQRVQIPQGPILDVFLSTDIPEAMARHLDQHPDELQAMIRMRPGHQLAAIKKLEGRLEAQIEASSKAAPAGSAAVTKPTTKAHPPINPVVGSHVAASDDPPGDDATDEQWYAYYDRQGNPRKR